MKSSRFVLHSIGKKYRNAVFHWTIKCSSLVFILCGELGKLGFFRTLFLMRMALVLGLRLMCISNITNIRSYKLLTHMSHNQVVHLLATEIGGFPPSKDLCCSARFGVEWLWLFEPKSFENLSCMSQMWPQLICIVLRALICVHVNLIHIFMCMTCTHVYDLYLCFVSQITAPIFSWNCPRNFQPKGYVHMGIGEAMYKLYVE